MSGARLSTWKLHLFGTVVHRQSAGLTCETLWAHRALYIPSPACGRSAEELHADGLPTNTDCHLAGLPLDSMTNPPGTAGSVADGIAKGWEAWREQAQSPELCVQLGHCVPEMGTSCPRGPGMYACCTGSETPRAIWGVFSRKSSKLQL